MVRAARRLLNRNYYYAKARWLYHYYRARRANTPPIVVYQMGKVGSSTVVASLETLRLAQPIYHIHTLTEEGIRYREKIYEEIYQGRPRNFARMSHLLASRCLRRDLARGLPGGKWKIVTLVREPITRNVSDFFQLLDWWIPDFTHRYNAKATQIDEAIQVFLERYRFHDEPLTWLDEEVKRVCGVDVFAKAFPTEKGYDLYTGDQVEVLLLKLERLNQCATDAFREFLSLDRFTLIKTNISDEKDYGSAYKDFIGAIRFPESYLEKMYASKYARHFYSEEEREHFRARWAQQPYDTVAVVSR